MTTFQNPGTRRIPRADLKAAARSPTSRAPAATACSTALRRTEPGISRFGLQRAALAAARFHCEVGDSALPIGLRCLHPLAGSRKTLRKPFDCGIPASGERPVKSGLSHAPACRLFKARAARTLAAPVPLHHAKRPQTLVVSVERPALLVDRRCGRRNTEPGQSRQV